MKHAPRAVVREMKALVALENRTVWDQGDLLVRKPLDDEQLEDLAKQCGVTANTLKIRWNVAEAFPAHEWDRTKASHSVFQVLEQRLHTTEERREYLDRTPPGGKARWTSEAMARTISEDRAIPLQVPPSVAYNRARQLTVSPGFTIDCRMTDKGHLEIEFNGDLEGNVRRHVVDGRVRLVVPVAGRSLTPA